MSACKSLSGVWVKNDDNNIRIIIERDYKKKSTVEYSYFMCESTGGGTMLKTDLVDGYERV